jgi:2-alkenal reductase
MNVKTWLASAAAFTLLVAAACTGAPVQSPPTPGGAFSIPPPTSAAEQPTATPTAEQRIGASSPTPLAVLERTRPAPTQTQTAASALTTDDEAERIVAAEEEVLNRLYAAVLPSIVNITVAQRAAVGDTSPFGSGQQGQGGIQPTGQGSGFVWDDQGHIVTNNHVVAGADVVAVKFSDGTEVIAEVVGTDPFSDLAVVKVDLPKDRLKPVALGDSARLKVGQMAIAIGHPFGQTFTMTTGIVSAVGRLIPSGTTPFRIPEAVQTDAAINPGNSGGPLLDREARVIGINAQIESSSGANAGVGFAIPVNIAKKVVPALIKDGKYEYAYLGVSLSNMTQEIAGLMNLPDETRGALVVEITSRGPAERSGLRGATRSARSRLGLNLALGGDVIVKVNDTAIRGSDELIAYTALRARPGEKVKMTVIRDGKEQTIDVTLGTRPG